MTAEEIRAYSFARVAFGDLPSVRVRAVRCEAKAAIRVTAVDDLGTRAPRRWVEGEIDDYTLVARDPRTAQFFAYLRMAFDGGRPERRRRGDGL